VETGVGSAAKFPARPTDFRAQQEEQASMIDFASAFPNSRKVYEERPVRLTRDGDRATLSIPMREVALSGGEPSLRLYDTSGPQGHAVRDGLPKLREPWIAARRATGHV